ncbi:hypothetical protein C6381_00150 [Pseudomonas syringae pv. actinidiae]|nr:hypothetical protein C6381_00150 [Pseudomonas syringae pv. actinidiae]
MLQQSRLSFLTLRPRHLSFLTLQRRNALGDALRHKSVPRCRLKIGRGASRTACARSVAPIVKQHLVHYR